MANSNIEAVYRLSPIQEGMLFHFLKSGQSGVYFEQFSCLLSGPLDVHRFKAAWGQTVQRHPVLRTLFTWEGRQQPLQLVRPAVELPWSHLDWSELSKDQQQSQFNGLLQRDRDRGFDIEQAPLFRLHLIDLGKHSARLLWSFHHLLLDGWSMRLVIDEVLQHYQQSESYKSIEINNPPPYVDFIRWLERRDPSEETRFWQKSLAGYRKTARILPDCFRENKGQTAPVFTQLAVEHKQRQRLERFAKSQRLTLNNLMVGAWSLVLSRYSHSNDVVFGTTVSGRSLDLDGINSIVGLFINTLPFRSQIEPSSSVVDYLHDIQRQQTQIQRFEQTPLTDIQRNSDMPPGTDLFDNILVFENFPHSKSTQACDLTLSETNYVEYSHYDLAILVVPGEEFQLIAAHDSCVYSIEFARRLLQQLLTVALQMSQPENLTLADISMVSDNERQCLLHNWNSTDSDLPDTEIIHRLIEQNAVKYPQSVALIFDTESISYAELNSRANRLANYLIEHQVEDQVAVPFLLKRSLDSIIALVAILKAGTAYIPLDPNFSEGRVKAVYDDLCSHSVQQQFLAICRTETIDAFSQTQFEAICLNRLESEIAGYPDTNPNLSIDSDQLAYIIYTSGSTGRAKGVMISHRSLLNSNQARFDYYSEDIDSFLLLSSLATDSSIAGLFWTLTSGATLVLSRDRIEQDIYALVDCIEKYRISHLLCLPSLYQLILEHAKSESLNSLRTVIVAGEACHREVLTKHCEYPGGAALYNEYGPSEACVWTSVERLDQLSGNQRIGIGRPINNQRLYILDSQQRLLAIGVAGELCIAGTGLAQGYFNQPEKTITSFVDNPYDENNFRRLYRSGDLVRYLGDGRIEFLGRIDEQLKIRGFRVELQEIEEALKRHDDVNESVVLLNSTINDEEEKLLTGLSNLTPEHAEQLVSGIETMDPLEVATELAMIST